MQQAWDVADRAPGCSWRTAAFYFVSPVFTIVAAIQLAIKIRATQAAQVLYIEVPSG